MKWSQKKIQIDLHFFVLFPYTSWGRFYILADSMNAWKYWNAAIC